MTRTSVVAWRTLTGLEESIHLRDSPTLTAGVGHHRHRHRHEALLLLRRRLAEHRHRRPHQAGRRLRRHLDSRGRG